KHPHAVPPSNFHAVSTDHDRDIVHSVGTAAYPEHADAGRRVEGSERIAPSALQRRLDGRRPGVSGHDRHHALWPRAPAELRDERLRGLHVPENAVTQHAVETRAVYRLVRV